MDKQDIKVQARPKGLFYGWIIIGACYLMVFTVMASFYSFGVFFKPMSGEFGWSRAQTSLAVSINLMTGAFFSLLAGRLVDKYKPRNIMIACAVLSGISYMLMPRVSGLGQFYLLYGFVLGVAMSANYVIPSVLVNRWFVKKRGLGLGLVFASFGTAQMIAPPLAAALIDTLGWRQMYVYMGIIVFVITAVSALFLRGSPEEMGLLPDGGSGGKARPEAGPSGHGSKKAVQGLTILETVRTPAFWLISVLWLFMAFPVYMIVVHLIPYSTDVGISVVAAASIMTAAGMANIAGRVGLGHFSDKFGARRILLVSFVLIVLGLLLLIKARGLLAFYVSVVLVSAFLNGGDTVVIKVLGDMFGMKSLGFIVGFTSLAWRLGASSGAYLAGVFFDITNSYAVIFSLAALAIYVCFILTFFIFGKKPAPAPAAG